MVVKVVKIFFLCFIVFGCNSKDSRINNQITISIKVIDSESGQPRVNDTVTVRRAKWGIPRKYVEIGEYITDSLGVVSFKISKDNRYSFETNGPNYAFGSDEYGEGELKNNQQIIIKVVPPDKKKFRIE